MEPNDVELPAPKSSNLVPILLGVNAVLLTGGLVFFLLRGGSDDKKKEPASSAASAAEEEPAGDEPGPKVGPTLKLPDFVVRLRDPDLDRYVKMSFELELAKDEHQEEVKRYLPRIRDLILSYLADRTSDELQGSEGLRKTKDELGKKVTAVVPGKKIRALYITDFYVQ